MEIDPIEMMALCIALLDHVVSLANPIAGLDGDALAAAQSGMVDAIDLLAEDPAAVAATIEEIRLMVGEMPPEELEEASAFCLEMAENI